MMYTFATVCVLFALTLSVIRAILGPTPFDRILAANMIGTLAILLLTTIGFLAGRPEWLDIGLTYAFLNLIGTLAALKYFRQGDLASDQADEDAQPFAPTGAGEALAADRRISEERT